MATRASRQSELSCRYRQDLASVTSAGTICVTFEDLRRRHVEPFLEWLLLLVGFLTERPREVLDALRRLQGPRGGGMAVACVCRSWRAAAEAVPYGESSGLATGPGPQPLRPVLCLAPDGRAGFSTGTGSRPWPGSPSVWDWLEAVAWLYFVDLPLVYRKVTGDGDSTWPVGHLISPPTEARPSRASAPLRALHCLVPGGDALGARGQCGRAFCPKLVPRRAAGDRLVARSVPRFPKCRAGRTHAGLDELPLVGRARRQFAAYLGAGSASMVVGLWKLKEVEGRPPTPN